MAWLHALVALLGCPAMHCVGYHAHAPELVLRFRLRETQVDKGGAVFDRQDEVAAWIGLRWPLAGRTSAESP